MKQILSAIMLILVMLALSSCDTIPLLGNDKYVDPETIEQDAKRSDVGTNASDRLLRVSPAYADE